MFLTLLRSPSGAAAALPGVSVAPQAGAPGTQFEVTGRGTGAPNSAGQRHVAQGRDTGRPSRRPPTRNGPVPLHARLDRVRGGRRLRVAVRRRRRVAATTRFAIASPRNGALLHGRDRLLLARPLPRLLGGARRAGDQRLSRSAPSSARCWRTASPTSSNISSGPGSNTTRRTTADSQVLLGQFGRRIRPADPPAAPECGADLVPETGHNVPNDFYAYWTSNGGVAQFGLPISEAFSRRSKMARPTGSSISSGRASSRTPRTPPPYDVLLGQFGRMMLAQVRR